MSTVIPGTSVRHGTVSGYSVCNGGGRLACADCRRARSEHAAFLARQRAYGRQLPTDRVDPTRALQALHALALSGHNTMAIAHLTGLTDQQVGRLLNHGQSYVTRQNHERILAGYHWFLRHPTWELHAPPVLDSGRTVQQVRSLQALGWPVRDVCAAAGVGVATISTVSRTGRVERTVANRIQNVYDRLSGTRGPCRSTATIAARNGWHTPLAYDDDGQLIPEAIPSEFSRAAERREDRRAKEQQVHELTAKDLSAKEIADRLGVSTRYVTRARSSRRTA